MTARDTAAKFTVRLAQPSEHLSMSDWKSFVATEDDFGTRFRPKIIIEVSIESMSPY